MNEMANAWIVWFIPNFGSAKTSSIACSNDHVHGGAELRLMHIFCFVYPWELLSRMMATKEVLPKAVNIIKISILKSLSALL